MMKAVREMSRQGGQSVSHGKGEENGFRQVQINAGAIKVQYRSIYNALQPKPELINEARNCCNQIMVIKRY